MENTIVSGESLRYCLYARKSTLAEDKQALSIDAQVQEMTEIAKREDLKIVEIKQEAFSSKDAGQRAIFNKMIEEIKDGRFNAILTWAPDRLGRNAPDIALLIDLLDKKRLIEIRTYSQRFTNNPNEKFLLMILGAQGKLENDAKAVNVKRGLRARCLAGLWPAPAPTGFLNNPNRDKKCQPIIDPKRAPVVKKMFEFIAYENWSGRKVFRWLRNEVKFETVNGKPLTLGNVYMILNNHFYTGTFEYPKNSGNWYQGKYEALISKELFDTVQENLKARFVSRTESKEFAFTQLMKCGLCGSGVTAEEKFKQLIDGGVNRHVYYFCTKARNIDCKNARINEYDLIKEFLGLMDRINLNELEIKAKVENELQRYNSFRHRVLGIKQEKQEITDIDIRNYAKHILRQGSLSEKRELLLCLRSRLILENKKLNLE